MPRAWRTVALAAAASLLGAAAPRYQIRTVAGSELSGDGGPALSAQLGGAECVAVDIAGNLYIADSIDHRVRKVAPAGTITTVAGTGAAGYGGDGGPASSALLDRPYGLAVDITGSLYIADYGNGRVRKVTPDGTISTVAGPDVFGVRLAPRNVAAAPDGTLFLSDFDNNRILRLLPDGRMLLAATGVDSPAGLAVDGRGALYIAESRSNRVRKLDAGQMFNLADGLAAPTGLALGGSGDLYIAEGTRLRKRSASGLLTVVLEETDYGVRDVAADIFGNLWVAAVKRVRKVSAQGVSTVAGSGAFGFSGDGGPAALARLSYPAGLAYDPAAGLYISDQRNGRLRRVSLDGIIVSLVQGGTPGALALSPGGDLWVADQPAGRIWQIGQAGIASLEAPAPTGIAFDAKGGAYVVSAGGRIYRWNVAGPLVPFFDGGLKSPAHAAVAADGAVYVSDPADDRIYRIDAAGKSVALALGALKSPGGLAIDAAGNLFFCDSGNHRVRVLTAAGELHTVAGDGTRGFAGDGGAATEARLNLPLALAMGQDGEVFVADAGNNRVRVLTPVKDTPPEAVTSPEVRNAASGVAGPLAPGLLVEITGIGTAAGAEVYCDAFRAPVLASSAERLLVQVPYKIVGRAAVLVEVLRKDGSKISIPVPAAAVAPGIFPALLNQDGTRNSASNPAARGSVVSLFLTGEGQTDPPGVEGVPPPLPCPKPLAKLALLIGGTPAELLYAGCAPGQIGVMQINARLPGAYTASGAAAVTLALDGVQAQAGVTVAVQ